MIRRIGATLVLVATTAVLSFAQPGPGMGQGMGREGFRPRAPRAERITMFERLNLSEKQKEDMEKMRLDLQKKQTALQAKVRLAQLDIRELFLAEKPDQSAIAKKMKDVSDLRHQEKLNHLDHLFAVRTILTPEQQKIWKDHMLATGAGMRESRMRDRIERRIERRIESRIDD